MLSVGFSHSQDRFFQTLNGPSVVFTSNTDIILLWKPFSDFFFKKKKGLTKDKVLALHAEHSVLWLRVCGSSRGTWLGSNDVKGDAVDTEDCSSGSYPSPNAQKISFFNHFSPEVLISHISAEFPCFCLYMCQLPHFSFWFTSFYCCHVNE